MVPCDVPAVIDNVDVSGLSDVDKDCVVLISVVWIGSSVVWVDVSA